MNELKDVQARLLWSRNTAEKLITEAKHELYLWIANRIENKVRDTWQLQAADMADRISVWESVMEETWPIVSEGGIREEPPNKNPYEY